MSLKPTHISTSEFNFDLPDSQIAKYPLPNRSDSKLLVYRAGQISDRIFHELAEELESGDQLIFNDAKVIPARMYFKRETGAVIEVLLLEPVLPASYEEVFRATDKVHWACMVGNLKKWKEEEWIKLQIQDELELKARLVNREERIVELIWDGGDAFIDVLEKAGNLPIPPYLNRDTEESDYQTYQTVVAKNNGSVAAPTAALHFTDELLSELSTIGIKKSELTLHVGAGTFLPVKHDNVLDHPMHKEFFEVSLEQLQAMREAKSRIAVGTTSLRVLESLYYVGAQIQENGSFGLVQKLEAYEKECKLSYDQALEQIIKYMEKEGLSKLHGATEIMILPHYHIKSIKALITNFHLPESTLLMLISSVVGEKWKEIYQHALNHNYRFLSYGDSSLLFVG